MSKNIMVDIETLSTSSNAVILSIGAAFFDLENEVTNTFYVNIDVKDSRKYGLDISKSTLEWWSKQKPEALKQTQVDCLSLKDAMDSFIEWSGTDKGTVWYCNGMNFDFPIMRWSMNAVGLEEPWQYYNLRDARTIYSMANLNMYKFPRVGTYHNALDDVLTQINALKHILS